MQMRVRRENISSVCLTVWHIRIEMPSDIMCVREFILPFARKYSEFSQLKYILVYSNIHGAAGVFLYRYGQ